MWAVPAHCLAACCVFWAAPIWRFTCTQPHMLLPNQPCAGVVAVWDVTSGALLHEYEAHSKRIWSVDFCEVGGAGGRGWCQHCWASGVYQAGSIECQLPSLAVQAVCSAFVPLKRPAPLWHCLQADPALLASGSDDCTVKLWSTKSPSSVAQVRPAQSSRVWSTRAVLF